MERYIGDLKNRLTNMASIDANLAHGALKMELLHHLPLPESRRDGDVTWPQLRQRLSVAHITTIKADGSKVVELPLVIKGMLNARFGAFTRDWPMELGRVQDHQNGSTYFGMERISLYSKIELVWRLPIGSEYSQGEVTTTRRDDSFISWKVHGTTTLRYGRVVVFCKCYDWDDLIVIVRPFKKVAYTPEFSLPFVLEGLGGVESIKHTEIVSIIGRIEKPEDTKKVTYLVRNRAESSLEVSPGSLDSVLW